MTTIKHLNDDCESLRPLATVVPFFETLPQPCHYLGSCRNRDIAWGSFCMHAAVVSLPGAQFG